MDGPFGDGRRNIHCNYFLTLKLQRTSHTLIQVAVKYLRRPQNSSPVDHQRMDVVRCCPASLDCSLPTVSLWVQRLRRETSVWKRLSHPNVVRLLGTVFTGMVSPWMASGNLNGFSQTNLSLSHRLQLVGTACSPPKDTHDSPSTDSRYRRGSRLP